MAYINKIVVNGAEVQANSIEGIQDASGHNRFIEGDITNILDNTFTKSYGKWSLSGTHLMIVIAGAYESAREFTTGVVVDLATITIPSWIGEKLYAVDGVLDSSSIKVVRQNNAYYTELEMGVYLTKTSDTELKVALVPQSTHTLDFDSYLRTNFDMLIDND